MTPKFPDETGLDRSPFNRRAVLRSTLAAAGAGAIAPGMESSRADQDTRSSSDARKASPKPYRMKKSINLWAFPYPQRMSLRECLQLARDAGFEGIELNYDLEND